MFNPPKNKRMPTFVLWHVRYARTEGKGGMQKHFQALSYLMPSTTRSTSSSSSLPPSQHYHHHHLSHHHHHQVNIIITNTKSTSLSSSSTSPSPGQYCHHHHQVNITIIIIDITIIRSTSSSPYLSYLMNNTTTANWVQLLTVKTCVTSQSRLLSKHYEGRQRTLVPSNMSCVFQFGIL